MMTPTTCGVGPSLSRTQTLIINQKSLVEVGGSNKAVVGHPPEHATKTPVATKATQQRRQTRTSPRSAFPSEGHGARNCLHPDPCSVRSRQSPHHASVRKGGHQIHIFEGGEPHEKVTLGSLFGPLPSKSGSVRKGSHRFTSWRVENSAKNTQPRGRASPGFIKTSRSISDETTHRRTIWTIIRAHPGAVSSEGYVD